MTETYLCHKGQQYPIMHRTETIIGQHGQECRHYGQIIGHNKHTGIGLSEPLVALSADGVAEALKKIIDEHQLRGKVVPQRDSDRQH